MTNEPKVAELVELELETVAAGKAPPGAGASAGSFQKGGSAQKKRV